MAVIAMQEWVVVDNEGSREVVRSGQFATRRSMLCTAVSHVVAQRDAGPQLGSLGIASKLAS